MNSLDDVTQDQSTPTDDDNALSAISPDRPRVYINLGDTKNKLDPVATTPQPEAHGTGILDILMSKIKEARDLANRFKPADLADTLMKPAVMESVLPRTSIPQAIMSGVTLPGDVFSGKVPVTDAEGNTSPEVIRRGVDFAGLGGGGAFEPRGTASLGAGLTRPAVAGEAPVFTSALENAVSVAKQPSAPGQQWLGFLKNQPGVKPEELHWSGVEDYLNNAKGPVSKDDLMQHLQNNNLQLNEVTKQGTNDEFIPEQTEARTRQEFDQLPISTHTHFEDWLLDTPEGEEAYNRHLADVKNEFKDHGGSVQYDQYQLPGGENYREHLITMPKSNDFVVQQNPEGRYGILNKKTGDWVENATAGSPDQLKDSAFSLNQKGDTYKSSHWDEPNVLAHIRTNDREVEGVPSHHIEEIQSDWHQAGRKRGYQNEGLSSDEAKELQQLHDRYATDGRTPKGESWTEEEDNRYHELIDKRERAKAGVPNAPFKATDQWAGLAMKRMIRQAVDEGKTRVSWTPGEAQAARYDLSKTIDTLVYKDGELQAFQKGRPVINQKVGEDKLADVIGKEAAERLLKQEPKNGGRALQGEELKVGGEGMKGFYDNILPKVVEKLGKPYGVKVKQGVLPGERIGRNTTSDQSVHYFDIPPKMADTVKGKGFPLFVGGVPVLPVDHNPFERKKNASQEK